MLMGASCKSNVGELLVAARAGRFVPRGVRDGDGDEQVHSVEVQTDTIDTRHLAAKEDARSYESRLKQYVRVLSNDVSLFGLFEDADRLVQAAQVVVDASLGPAQAKALLKSACPSKQERKMVYRALRAVDGLKSTAVEHSYSLSLLQRWYAGEDKQRLRQEHWSYEMVKAHVEEEFVKLTSPYCFVHRVQTKERNSFDLVTETSVRGVLKNTYYYEFVTGGGDHDDLHDDDGDDVDFTVKRHKFVDRWLGNEDIKTFSHLTFDPSYCMGQQPNIRQKQASVDLDLFNTWSGFAAEWISPVSDDIAAAAFDRYSKHISDVVGDNSVCSFVLDYFAHVLQRPEKKTGVCILLQGSQGCGKGTIFDKFRDIVGHDVSFRTAKAKDHLFSRFSNGLKNNARVCAGGRG